MTFGSPLVRPFRTSQATGSTWSCKPCRSPMGMGNARSFCVRPRSDDAEQQPQERTAKTTNPALDAGSRPAPGEADSRAAGIPDGFFCDLTIGPRRAKIR